MSRKKTKKILTSLLLIAMLVAIAFYFYQRFFSKVHLKDKNYTHIFIEHGHGLEELTEELEAQDLITDRSAFLWLAEKMELQENIHPGKFRIIDGMTMRQIINLIKYNKQEKVKLTFNSQIHDINEFVTYADEKLELSLEELEDLVTDEEKLKKHFKLDPDNCLAMLVPGPVEVSWAITAEELMMVLKDRYNKTWTVPRLAQAKKIGFTPAEVATIASIVQSESAIESEQEKIAGVYINRIKKNMPLQADPTLKFANRNFNAMRVLDVDKEIDSPYNTYRYKGLPPGPICIVTIQSIDATLNYGRHNFIFFCAKPQLNGFSDFSTTYEQHRKYALAYQKALNKIGISR